MSLLSVPVIATASPAGPTAGQPLFGSFPLALLAICGCIAALLVFVVLLGRWLAATHPEASPRPVAPPVSAPIIPPGVSPEIAAVIAASIAAVLGSRARITAVALAPVPATASVEMLMQQWSMEGRRQIYSSHKVR